MGTVLAYFGPLIVVIVVVLVVTVVGMLSSAMLVINAPRYPPVAAEPERFQARITTFVPVTVTLTDEQVTKAVPPQTLVHWKVPSAAAG
jgi:hypothetical protein